MLGAETRAIPNPPDVPEGYGQPGYGSWGAGMVWNGVPGAVTHERSMRLSAVFACLRLLSEAIASMPLDTFIRNNGVRRPWRPRPEYLNFLPSKAVPQNSAKDYLSQVMMSLLTSGNA